MCVSLSPPTNKQTTLLLLLLLLLLRSSLGTSHQERHWNRQTTILFFSFEPRDRSSQIETRIRLEKLFLPFTTKRVRVRACVCVCVRVRTYIYDLDVCLLEVVFCVISYIDRYHIYILKNQFQSREALSS